MNNGVQMSVLSKTPSTYLQGVRILSKGVRQSFRDPLIMLFCLLPIMCAVVFLYFGFSFFYSLVGEFIRDWTINNWSFDFFGGAVLLAISKFIIGFFSGIVLLFLIYIMLQIVYIPFYSLIAERILKKHGIEQKFGGFSGWVVITLRMLRVALLKTIIFLIIGLVCFLLSFFPILAFLPLFFGYFAIAYDSFDYPLEILELGLSERFNFMRNDFFMISGHMTVLGLLSFVPGLVFLTLPFAVAGASSHIGEIYETKRRNT